MPPLPQNSPVSTFHAAGVYRRILGGEGTTARNAKPCDSSLLSGLHNLSGLLNSLSFQRIEVSVQALAKFLRQLATRLARGLTGSTTLDKGPAELRIPAAHAALTAAEKMAEQGKDKTAQKLLKSVRGADVPEYLKKVTMAM